MTEINRNHDEIINGSRENCENTPDDPGIDAKDVPMLVRDTANLFTKDSLGRQLRMAKARKRSEASSRLSGQKRII